MNHRQNAPCFTVFDFIKPQENVLVRYSQIPSRSERIAWQGEAFLRLLIAQVFPTASISHRHIRVVREALTYSLPQKNRRRIDILIEGANFIVGIEIKKYALEGLLQIEDYCQHLKNIAKDRPFSLVFLTSQGHPATSIEEKLAGDYQERGELRAWSWEKDIAPWLEQCRSQCGANKVHHFLEDFQTYVAAYLTIQSDNCRHS